MNPIDRDEPFGDDHRFDLLADGQLGEAERRELLAGLDDEPGGWRQCALAFLQAQALEQDLGSILAEPVIAEPVVDRPAERPRRRDYGTTLTAMAAAFLVALFLGSQLPKLWRESAPSGGPPTEFVETVPQLQPLDPQPNRPKEEMFVETQPSSPSAPTWYAEFAGPDEESGPIRVPFVERDQIDEDWLRNLPAAVPADVARRWEQIGHPVRQRRRLLPFRLNDGRRAVVPVDEVDVHYVNRPAL